MTEAGDEFLYLNEELRELNLPQLKKVGSNFLYNSQMFDELDLINDEKEEKKKVIKINPKEIAELDRDTELTTTEVNIGKDLIEKNMSSTKDNIQK